MARPSRVKRAVTSTPSLLPQIVKTGIVSAGKMVAPSVAAKSVGRVIRSAAKSFPAKRMLRRK